MTSPDPTLEEAAPPLTIAVLTWNRADDVIRCLESLVGQAAEHGVALSLLVNGSDDGTTERVRVAFPDLEVHESPVNLGCPAGRNRLVELSRSEWVAFIDDDGVAPPDLVEVMLREINTAPSDRGVIAGYMVDPDITPPRRFDSGPVGSFCAGVCAVRRSSFLDVGGFHEDGLRQGEEGELSIRLFDQGMTIQRASDLTIIHPLSSDKAKRRDLLRSGLRQSLLTGVKLSPWWMLPGWTIWKLLSFLRVAISLRAPGPYLAGIGDVIRALPSAFRARKPVSARAMLATSGRIPRLAQAARTRLRTS